MNFRHMDDQNSLERLKSIRERYGCQKNNSRTPQNKIGSIIHNYQYTNQTARLPSHNYPISGLIPASTARQAWKDEGRDAKFERNDRSYSLLERNKNIEGKLLLQTYDSTTPKKHDHFTGFIKDLDTRISQKQKMLNARLKQNEKLFKQRSVNPQSEINRLSAKYKSSKNLRYFDEKSEWNRQKVQSTFRDVSDRSLIQKYANGTRQNEISRNQTHNDHLAAILEKKRMTYENPLDQRYKLGKLYTESVAPLRQNIKDNYSPIKRLDNRQVQNIPIRREKDSWNISKMENIQQRIQSVLKQSNY